MFDAVCMMLQSHALFCCPNTLLTVVFAWVDKHTARTFGLLAAYVLEFDTYYWCSLQHELVISSSSCAVQKIHYNGGDASALVECMKRASSSPWANRTYVCIAACVLKLERVIDVRSSKYNVVVISCTLMCYFAVQTHYLLLALAGRTDLLGRRGGREVRST